MAAWSEMSGGARAAVVVAGVAVVGLLGAVLWVQNQPAAPVANDLAAPANLTAPPQPAAPPEPVAPAIAQDQPVLPSFDTSRVDAEGNALVSGRAEPGSIVTVKLNGLAVADSKVSDSGEFVMLFTLPPNTSAGLLTLEALLADDTLLISDQSVALGPIPGPAAPAIATDAAADTKAEGAQVESTASSDQPNPPGPDAAPDLQASESGPDSVLLTEQGVKVLQAPGALAPDGETAAVLLDSIAYSPAGDVQLAGKGQGGQSVQIYLDNQLVATQPIGADGTWQLTLSDTKPGIYTMRLDQIDATAKVTARFETPFKRETREALAALIAPPAAPETQAQPQPQAQQEAQPETQAEPAPAAPVASDTVAQPLASAAPSETAAPAASLPPETTTASPVSPQSQPPAAQSTAPLAEAPLVAPDQPLAPAPGAAQGAAVPQASVSGQEPAPEAAPALPQPIAPAPLAQTEVTPQPPVAPPSAPDVPAALPEAAPAAAAAPQSQPASEPAPAPAPGVVTVTVQPGYTLWGIARETFGNGVLYVQVYKANKDKIRNPDLIYPGQVFTLPVEQ
jgi:nucleoid-associated protein YgaU